MRECLHSICFYLVVLSQKKSHSNTNAYKYMVFLEFKPILCLKCFSIFLVFPALLEIILQTLQLELLSSFFVRCFDSFFPLHHDSLLQISQQHRHEFDIFLRCVTVRKTCRQAALRGGICEPYDSDESYNLELSLDSHPYCRLKDNGSNHLLQLMLLFGF